MPIGRLNREIKRRTEVVGISPNEATFVRPVGGKLLEQCDAWATKRSRDITPEAISTVSEAAAARLLSRAGLGWRPSSPTIIAP
ncbi:transposase [Elioraea tepida]|uniref:Transposase n=1 Tax=Elioraea tepida TaxID=2843330 RepID=A0A975YLA1_9PROT|nr:transposase [Elioraea tepida]